jgi:hypothetical protein
LIDANTKEGNKILSTGSYNWEVPADIGNDENSLTLFDARINNLYFQEFHQRYIESGGESIGINGTSDEVIPKSLLIENYPNPFHQITTIIFRIAETNRVSLEVYDMTGCKVVTFENQVLNPATYQLQFDGTFLTSGLYFCKITVGDYSETIKMMLVK